MLTQLHWFIPFAVYTYILLPPSWSNQVQVPILKCTHSYISWWKHFYPLHIRCAIPHFNPYVSVNYFSCLLCLWSRTCRICIYNMSHLTSFSTWIETLNWLVANLIFNRWFWCSLPGIPANVSVIYRVMVLKTVCSSEHSWTIWTLNWCLVWHMAVYDMLPETGPTHDLATVIAWSVQTQVTFVVQTLCKKTNYMLTETY